MPSDCWGSYKMVEVLLQLPGVNFHQINMCRLYMAPFCDQVNAHNRPLQQALRQYDRRNDGRSPDPADAHAMFQKALAEPFGETSKVLRGLLFEYSHTRANDIFVWLLFHNNIEMARLVWPVRPRPPSAAVRCAWLTMPACPVPHLRESLASPLPPPLWQLCDFPVHMALVGMSICLHWARALPPNSVEQDAAYAQVAELESWAVGALNEARSQDEAMEVLQPSLFRDADVNTLLLAVTVAAKRFIAHHRVKPLIDLYWRGGHPGSRVILPAGFTYAKMLFAVFFPFLSGNLLKEIERTDLQDHSRPNASYICYICYIRYTRYTASSTRRTTRAPTSRS